MRSIDGFQYVNKSGPSVSLFSKSGGTGSGFGTGGFNGGLPQEEAEWMAWFKLIFCSVFFLLSSVTLWRFFQVRHVLEIRARSAYLVTAIGVCLLLKMAMYMHIECVRLFDARVTVFMTHLLYFFVSFTVESCYIGRVIRLGVAFCPRIKRAIPWIMSERLLVTGSVCIGLLAMFIPGYYFHITDGPDHLVRFVLVELDVVWKCQIGLTVIQVAFLPVVWMVNDIFKISLELAVIIFVGLLDVVGTKLADGSMMADEVKQIINSSNFGILSTAVLFGLSTLEGEMDTANTSHICSPDDQGEDLDDLPDSSNVSISASSTCTAANRICWSYDKMAAVPAVAEAFRAFALRALCQESVIFLEEVTKYTDGDYSISSPTPSQFAAFSVIIRRFIIEGSPDEINISSKDRQGLMGVYRAGALAFGAISREDRRSLFQEAYTEIRSMLEVNLLHRFIDTENFRDVEIDKPTTIAHEREAQPGGEQGPTIFELDGSSSE